VPDQPAAVVDAIAHVARLATGPALHHDLRVTLNFHPDRLVGGGTVLAAMARDGVYRSQFETGTSNGGLTAHPGGDRWAWESRIFGGAYDDADAALRPKYGALDRHRSPVGAAPRFGSAHVRLASHTLAATTFCFPDSVFHPEHFGVAAAYALSELADARPALFPGQSEPDPLDDYVEAHVHGVVALATDVEALVLDPSFRGTEVEDDARAWERLGVAVEWHDGWALPVDELRAHPDYRGPEFVELGESVAVDGVLTPRVVGDAVRTGRHDPQHLKRVWHLVARFGRLSPPS
jgi:hypothetical protein